MSCKTPYVLEGQYVIVKDNSGNILVQYLNKRNKCRKVFDIELVTIHNIPMEDINNVQVYIDNKRIR